MRKNLARFFLLALYLFNITPVFAEEDIEYRFERLWPRLEQPWYFDEPQGLAIAPNGNVYVADTRNHHIQLFSDNGNFIRSWGSEGSTDGQFQYPTDIAIAPDGSIYVTDTENNRIQQFTSQGDFIRTWEVISPYGIAIASNGNIYVAQRFNHSIKQFSAHGDFIRTWGSEGAGNGQFNYPNNIAIASDDSIYIADSGNNRIQQFTSQGDFIKAWGSKGKNNGQFGSPGAIAIASDGSVYVIDYNSSSSNHHIQQFTAQGDFIRAWGSFGSGNGQFGSQGAIAISSDGSVYVADSNNNRIQQFTSQGDFIKAWESLGLADGYFYSPNGIAIAPNDSIYVVDTRNHRIQHFDTQGGFIRAWGVRGAGSGQFYFPWDITIAPDGSVYVADWANDRIQQFTSQGDFIRAWGSKGENNGQFRSPGAIAIASDGSVYVGDAGRIQQFTAQGDFIRSWGSMGADNGQFAGPVGIAIASDDSVYVADTENNRIQQFTPKGDFIQAWGSFGSGNGQFFFPENIAITSDGSIYVTDSANHRIQQFTAQGRFIQKWGSEGSLEGQLKRPSGVAVAADGSIYIADTNNNRIQKFAPKIKATTPHPYKAIILAGGGEKFGSGRTNSIWEGTWRIAKKAYRALTNQGFKAHEEIKFLTAGNTQTDLDNNQKLDDLEVATKHSLKLAITEWATDATDVVIYLSNHGGPGKFKINGTETLTSEELNSWVSQLEQKIPGKVTLVIEACNSASFFTQLAKPDRFLFASAKADQSAVIANDGLTSFSYTFWSEVATGAVVKTAFSDARQAMSRILYANEAQNSQAETDGNGVFNQQDLDLLGNYCLGECNKTAGAAPELFPFSPASQTLNGTTTLNFSITVDSLQPLNNVWALIQRPDDITIDTNQPLNFEKVQLSCNEQDQCQGRYDHFDLKGEYRLSVYAQDTQGEVSFPETLTVTQTQGKDIIPTQYNEQLATVYLRDVVVNGKHLQAALELQGNKFVVITHSEATEQFSPAAQFDTDSGILTIPHALVFGKNYKATFKYLGNLAFELESATLK